MTPDEVRMLDNKKAILLIRGERPLVDDKYDLMKHPNIKYTEDGGAGVYDYAKAPLARDTFGFDRNRYDDYELLAEDDVLAGIFDGRNADEI